MVRAVERSVRLPGDRRAVHAASFRGGFRRAYHFHVRKTGGTSLNRSFLGLGGEDPASVHWRIRGALHATRSNGRVYVAHDAPLLERGYYTYGWHHAPAWTLTLPPETFTITVLRDPISPRAVALPLPPRPRRRRRSAVSSRGGARARAAGGFESFVRSTPTVDLLNQVHMFSPRLDPAEAAEAVRHCSAWFMTEDLGQGVDRLNQSLGLDLKHRWDRRSRTDDGLRVQHGDLLRTVLAPEYELLQLLGAENDGPAGQPSSQSPDGIQLPRRS